MTFLPLDTTIPDSALIVLIGASGSGKSTLASTWPDTQVLELDRFRALVSDDPGDQSATPDAVAALMSVLEARLARKLTTVVDATSAKQSDRAELLARARRHGVPTVALLVTTPASVCVARQQDRPANRSVPTAVVEAQHAAIVDAFPGLPGEGFDHVVFAESIDRLEPLLQRLSDRRSAEQGLDGRDGLGDLLLVQRCFGPDILPMWRWLEGSQLAGGDRVGEIRLGGRSLTLALRQNVDGEGDIGFDILLACPASGDGDDCPGPAWAPVCTVSDLYRACLGELDDDEGLVCAGCGSEGEVDHEAADHVAGADGDPEGRADLEAQYAEAVRP